MKQEQTVFVERTWQRLAATVIWHALLDAVDQPINKREDYFERLRRLNRQAARRWIDDDSPRAGSVHFWCSLLSPNATLTPEALRRKLAGFDAGRDTIAVYARELGTYRTTWARHDRGAVESEPELSTMAPPHRGASFACSRGPQSAESHN